MKLLADLGNTRLKLASAEDGWPALLLALPHAAPDFAQRFTAWLGEEAGFSEVLFASVAPPQLTATIGAMFEKHGMQVRRVQTRQHTLGLTLAYPNHRQMGVDRWLALLALHAGDEVPCVAVSVGSALTCDALASGGRHLGGLIAPTPESMRLALRARAPGLPEGRGHVEELATNTLDAMESGCMLSSVALIERVQTRVAESLGSPVRLIVSGGGAEAMRPLLPPHEYRPDLVLHGLSLLSAAQKAGEF